MLLPNPLLANTRDRPPKTAMKKNVNTYVPTGKGVFYANFRVKVNDLRTGARTIQVNRATGLPDRCTAQAIANRMRDDVLLGFFDVLPRLRELPDVRAARRSPILPPQGRRPPEKSRRISSPSWRTAAALARWHQDRRLARRVLTHPRGVDTHLTPQGYDRAFQAAAVRRTAPRHALHSRSNDAQSGIKPCAPYSSTIAFECALISLIWSSSVRSLRTRHQYPTTALVI